MSASRKTQQIQLSQLMPGMFVVKLDIPWIESPFLKHSRLITSIDDINKLRKAGVRQVIIDTEKGDVPTASQNKTPTPGKVLTENKEISPNKLKQADNASASGLAKELDVAVKLRSEIKNTVRTINDKLERNLPINSDALLPLIDDTLLSLQRNDQALLNLVHLTHKSQKLIDHAFGTFCLALNLAVTVNFDTEERQALGIAALLHETGWLQLPLHLMGKRTEYTKSERALVQSHIEMGLRLLKESEIPSLSRRIIEEHHELCDGSGYPKGRDAQNTHRASKLFCVVDTYDEWVHQLLDKPGSLPTNALRALYKLAEQGRYDIEFVAGLINILGVYPISSAVLLSTGEKAVVEEVHREAHLSPVVRIEYDVNGRPLKNALRVDLRGPEAEGRIIKMVLDPSDPAEDPLKRLHLEVSE
ncbi:HD-GYP domain-containing protein (c-di-GMP phosphodiesterase class II) [Alteromonadaceae bacterium 2753L.S.0a.02]|nr:HD-GYP domain-containing protein (c-di-GMP phosphodiesterase class II) [Alteromonadaceae bacterium 2753L.S.0a.02]